MILEKLEALTIVKLKKYKFMVLFWTVIYMLFCGIAIAQSNPPAPSQGNSIQKHQRRTGDKAQESSVAERGSENRPIFVRSIDAPLSEEEANAKKYERKEKPTLDRWLTWSTVALAGFTALLFFFTYRLWSATARLVAGSEDTAIRQLRAYVALDPEHGYADSFGIPQKINFNLSNVGQTPANNIGYWCVVRVGDEDESAIEQITRNAPDIILSPSSFSLAPAMKSYSFINFKIPSGDIPSILNKSQCLFVSGGFIYADVFGQTRNTLFRLKWIMPNDSHTSKGAWAYCKQGNEIT